MLKKILIATTILAASSTAVVATAAPYVGVSTGVVNSSAKNGGDFRGMPLNIFAGYGTTINESAYLAGEVFGTVATGTLTNNRAGYSNLQSTYGYGASFIPGMMLSDRTLAFARLGVVRTRFSDIAESSTGGQFGLGMQTGITQALDLRGEYDYASYRRISDSNHINYSPRTDAFTIGVVYKIN